MNEANGIVSFSVGTGGRDPLSARELGTFNSSAVFGKQGVLGLTLEDESYSWAFHYVETGVALDEGQRDCNQLRAMGRM